MGSNFDYEKDFKKDDKTIELLIKALHGANETIDRQYSTILHLEEQIRMYESMGNVKKI